MARQQKKKYYVVWAGHEPGIYESWTECQLQTKGFPGAVFKSFSSLEEARQALASPPQEHVYRHAAVSSVRPAGRKDDVTSLPTGVEENALAVDAACSGNPGAMEYRGVYLGNRQVVFRFGPTYGTNNIGEFLAIVHALALLKQKGIAMPVYSDSRNAIAWVRQKKCKTQLTRNARTEELFRLIDRAERWLRDNDYAATPVRKWDTARWGEIPADFGRK